MPTSKYDRWISRPRATVRAFPGCCSAVTFSRLDSYRSYARRPNVPHANFWNLGDVLVDNTGWYVPLWVAYTAVLERIWSHRCESNAFLALATDNRTTSGDVVTGPFSTKKFIDWLEHEGLANISEHRAPRRMNGYIIDFADLSTHVNRQIEKGQRWIRDERALRSA